MTPEEVDAKILNIKITLSGKEFQEIIGVLQFCPIKFAETYNKLIKILHDELNKESNILQTKNTLLAE